MFRIITFPIRFVGKVLVNLVRFAWSIFIILLVAVITAFVGLVKEKR